DVVDEGTDDDASLVERYARITVLVAAHTCGEEVLPAILDPLHGTRELHRGKRDAHVFAHRHDLLAEAAARVAHDHPHLVFTDAEQASEEHANFVRRLRRGPHRELFARPFRDHPAVLHR